MATERTLGCACGSTRWAIEADAPGAHLECYCADCQTFARHLGADAGWLDAAGGTELFQTLPGCFAFVEGQENVRVLRLGPKGLLRWYASCCGSPVANTLPSPSIPFVSAILKPGQRGFGPVVAHVNTAAARSDVKTSGLVHAVAAIFARGIVARLTGRHRASPFFDAGGKPIVEPRVLTLEQRRAARPV